MHQPIHCLRRAMLGATTLLLAATVHAQSTMPQAVPAPAPMAERAPMQASGDQNTPPAIARQQHAEIARGDPARWHQEDLTLQARMRTMRKDIAAGLQENLGECRKQPAAERGACMREARATYQQEMANLGRMR